MRITLLFILIVCVSFLLFVLHHSCLFSSCQFIFRLTLLLHSMAYLTLLSNCFVSFSMLKPLHISHPSWPKICGKICINKCSLYEYKRLPKRFRHVIITISQQIILYETPLLIGRIPLEIAADF